MASGLTNVSLNTGRVMPIIGFGTFQIVGKGLIYRVIDAALASGYRSFDTAAVYGNEEDIGQALKELLPKYGLTRDDIFLTSKLAPNDHGKNSAERAARKSLSHLGVTYLDMYLVHWPGVAGIPMESSHNLKLRTETWNALSELYEKGILRGIGVSNYTVKHLEELFAHCKIKPAVNQVEFHPHFQQKELLKFCTTHGIHLQAYSSLGGSYNHSLVDDPVVTSIARKLGKGSAQVLLRWAVQQGVGVIPKSVTPNRIAENIKLNFSLSEEDMTALGSIKKVEKYAWNPARVA
ncbi:glyoxal reductase-like [Hetaerina americana]|uniref:glyoxal reductase-like n=1 Tax=Hetaerina americana TaxID=62018 RepID=UPI003A7F133D